MKYALIYESRSGNTRKLAEALGARLREAFGADSCLLEASIEGPSDSAPEIRDALRSADRVYVGFWTDKGSCPENLKSYLPLLSGKEVFLFGTAGFGGSQTYFDRILGNVRGLLPEEAVLTGSYMCQGRMQPAVRARYEAMAQSEPERAKPMLENFDRALSHPDEADVAGLLKAAGL